MQTGFNKSPDRIQAPQVALPPVEVQEQATLKTQPQGVQHDERTRPVCIIDEPSPSTITVEQTSSRKLHELAATSSSSKPLSGRVHTSYGSLFMVSIEFFFKYVKAAAKAMDQEVAAYRADERTWKEGETAKKERQQEKCKFFWQQAEELFHETFNRIREDRKLKGEKK